jgi:acetate kinase
MRILVLNCGSSSVKYQLFDIEAKQEEVLARGLVERIGLEGSLFTHESSQWKTRRSPIQAPDHTAALEKILSTLVDPERGTLHSLDEIRAVGHRVVHGGEWFSRSVLIDQEVMRRVRECISLAPLHNPHNISGIEASQKLMSGVAQVAVFDTAFHQTIPPYAYVYGIPHYLYQRYGIRRYGFHGPSHYYVAHRAAGLLGRPIYGLRIITCHLGNGCSITAINRGASVDTSMGFTPLEGLLMGTRCGDLDPGIGLFLIGRERLTADQVSEILNKQGGLLAISGISSDMRDIIEESQKGEDRAQLAIYAFAYRLRKYIGAYAASMGGLDVLVFTGGIGENASVVRDLTCQDLDFLGIRLDRQRNEAIHGIEGEISSDDSRIRVYCIPTNEELMIARDTFEIVTESVRK